MHIGCRARSSAEPALGAALMTTGPGGGLIRAARLRHAPSLGIAGIVLLGVGTLAMLGFPCLVYRRHAPAARLVALGLAVATIAGVVDQVSQPGLEQGHGQPYVLFVAARLLTFAWATYEAVRYRGMFAGRIELAFGLTWLQSRGTLRLMRKDVGLEADVVDRAQLSGAVERLLPTVLRQRGVAQTESRCRALARELTDLADDALRASAPEDVFARLGRS